MVVINRKINKFDAKMIVKQANILIMNARNENFIYAYDDEKHQIIVIDAETGERIEQRENRVLSILSYLNEKPEIIKMRKFTLWCAEQCSDDIKPLQKKFFVLARRSIEQKAMQPELEKVYSESEGEAVATDTVGLRQGSSAASGFLASRECVNPNAFEGAKKAARFHCLWAEMNREKKNSPEFLNKIGAGASEETIDRIEQKQVDYLLDLIGENMNS